ncbi:hypothetical protein BDY24DRAFT_385837 [Mrakia frigida]|uniref:uncharacterized protein n=1 Tax=Mrakia frigida TaxID=29902 RepID=UPI003FCC1097
MNRFQRNMPHPPNEPLHPLRTQQPQRIVNLQPPRFPPERAPPELRSRQLLEELGGHHQRRRDERESFQKPSRLLANLLLELLLILRGQLLSLKCVEKVHLRAMIQEADPLLLEKASFQGRDLQRSKVRLGCLRRRERQRKFDVCDDADFSNVAPFEAGCFGVLGIDEDPLLGLEEGEEVGGLGERDGVEERTEGELVEGFGDEEEVGGSFEGERIGGRSDVGGSTEGVVEDSFEDFEGDAWSERRKTEKSRLLRSGFSSFELPFLPFSSSSPVQSSPVYFRAHMLTRRDSSTRTFSGRVEGEVAREGAVEGRSRRGERRRSSRVRHS